MFVVVVVSLTTLFVSTSLLSKTSCSTGLPSSFVVSFTSFSLISSLWSLSLETDLELDRDLERDLLRFSPEKLLSRFESLLFERLFPSLSLKYFPL